MQKMYGCLPINQEIKMEGEVRRTPGGSAGRLAEIRPPLSRWRTRLRLSGGEPSVRPPLTWRASACSVADGFPHNAFQEHRLVALV